MIEITISSLVSLIIACYFIYVLLMVFKRLNLKLEKEEKGAKNQFFEALDTKFEKNLISDQSDVEVLKNAIERDTDTDFLLAPLLEDYLVYLGKRDVQASELSNRYELIKDIIKSENAKEPFSDVPEEERRLLIGLQTALEYDDKDSAFFNLNEISSVISTRSKDYERAMEAVAWSRPMAIVGLVASVILGIIALIR